IIDNDGTPTVQFAAATSNDVENVTPHTEEVTLSNPSSVATSVDYEITGGTATEGAGEDYVLANGTINFAGGDVSEEISITINDDAIAEGSETIIITLLTPSGVTLGTTIVHTHTILDDE